jgi:ATP-binding cassette subfamily B protein
LRHQIGFAMQGSIMFQGSILENLTFCRDIPLNDVEETPRVAYIHNYVAALPEGYQTEIGEQSTGLFKGQKQRLALARVLL